MPKFRCIVDWTATAGEKGEDGQFPFSREGARIWEGEAPDALVAEEVAAGEVEDYTITAFVEHAKVEEAGGNLDVTVKAQTATIIE